MEVSVYTNTFMPNLLEKLLKDSAFELWAQVTCKSHIGKNFRL